MTNEEKARELAEYYKNDIAKEKQQWIDKACEWWKNELTYPTMTQTEIDWYQTKISEFKKAMENDEKQQRLDKAFQTADKEDTLKEIIDYLRYQALNNPEVKDSRWKWIEYLKELKQQAQ